MCGHKFTAFTNAEEVERAWVMTAQGCKICLMVDSPKHVEILDNIIEGLKSKPEVYSDVLSWTVSKVMRQPVCIDLDVSWRPLGGLVHIGAHRFVILHLTGLPQTLTPSANWFL
jgi:hypothetical protein